MNILVTSVAIIIIVLVIHRAFMCLIVLTAKAQGLNNVPMFDLTLAFALIAAFTWILVHLSF